MKNNTVLLAAGGTGGHVYPALALADALLEQGIAVQWLGTKNGLEAKIVPQHNITLHTLSVYGLRGKGLVRWLKLPMMLLKSIIAAKKMIKMVNPAIIVGFGGYVAAPGGIAAWLLKKPLLIHEQNAKAGLTNRMLRLIATQTFSAFPGAFKRAKRVEVIGNPLRQTLVAQAKHKVIDDTGQTRRNLLVIGGSSGAKILNEIVPAALAQIPSGQRPNIWHQTGEKTIDIAKLAYKTHHIDAKITVYLHDMAAALNWADVVICRAGAMTVSEMALFAKPAIFIPYFGAVDNHQYYNCQYLVKQGAAMCVEQSSLNAEKLAKNLIILLQDNKKLVMMSRQAAKLALPQATEKLLTACIAQLTTS